MVRVAGANAPPTGETDRHHRFHNRNSAHRVQAGIGSTRAYAIADHRGGGKGRSMKTKHPCGEDVSIVRVRLGTSLVCLLAPPDGRAIAYAPGGSNSSRHPVSPITIGLEL